MLEQQRLTSCASEREASVEGEVVDEEVEVEAEEASSHVVADRLHLEEEEMVLLVGMLAATETASRFRPGERLILTCQEVEEELVEDL